MSPESAFSELKSKITKNPSRFIMLLVVLLLLNPVTNAQVNTINSPSTISNNNDIPTSSYKGHDLLKKIAVIYDPSHDAQAETAVKVYHSAGLVYHNIEFLAIETETELMYLINSDDYWIKIYFLDSGLDGIELDVNVSWEKIADELLSEKRTHHIFGSGSTDILKSLLMKYYIDEFLPVPAYVMDSALEEEDNIDLEFAHYLPNLHVEGSDIIDAELAYFFALWEIGAILAISGPDYRAAAEDFEILGIEYFARNLNELVNKQIQPENPLGDEDIEAKESAFEEKILDMGSMYYVDPKTGEKVDVAPEASMHFVGGETVDNSVPFSQLQLDEEEVDDPFTIASIPLFSGLEGPPADIIDTLLQIMIKIGGSKLGLDPQAANDIINTVKDLSLIISGATGSGDVKETLKSLLDMIMQKVPIPEALKSFVPLIIDAFFIIRGEVQDILDFAKSTITAIFSSLGSAFNASWITGMMPILEDVLLDTVTLAERIIDDKRAAEAAGKSFELLTTIQSFVIEKLLNFTTFEFMFEMIGVVNSTIVQEATQLMKIIVPLVKAFITRDYSELFNVVPDVVEYIANKFSGIAFTISDGLKSGINILMRMYHIGITLFNTFTEHKGGIGNLLFNGLTQVSEVLVDLFNDLIVAALPMLDLDLGSDISTDDVKSLVSSIFQFLKELGVDEESNPDTLRQLIEDAMAPLDIPDNAATDLLVDVLVILGQIAIPSMPNPGGSDFKGLISSTINVVANQFGGIVGGDVSESADLIVDNSEMILDVVFGFLAIVTDGGPAQFIFTDEGDLNEDGTLTEEAKSRIFTNMKNQTVNLISSFVSQFIEGHEETVRVFTELFINMILGIVSGDGDAIKSIFQTILMQGIQIFITKTLGIDGSIAMKIILNFFSGIFSGKSLGSTIEDSFDKTEILLLVDQALEFRNFSTTVRSMAAIGVEMLFGVKDLFSDTLQFLTNILKSAVTQFLTSIVTKLTTKLTDFLNNLPLLRIAGTLGFAGASFIGLTFSYDLSLSPNVAIDSQGLVDWLMDIIFRGLDDFDIAIIGEFFQKILSFVTFTPIFEATLGVDSMSSGKGGLFSAVLGAIGADLSIQGSFNFKLQLLSFTSGGFVPGGFLKILAFALSITIILSRDFTIFDIVTAGAGGGAINKVAKYIGLELLVLTLYLGFTFAIAIVAAHNGAPAQAKLELSLIIGASLTIGISLVIVGLSLKFGVEITLSFLQDLSAGAARPFQILLDVLFYAEVVLTFLFWDWDARFEFRPPGAPYDLTPRSKEDLQAEAKGFDWDLDGLPDNIEMANPLLNMNEPDTDFDGLSDKFEMRVSNTDPSIPDTDGDGLSDFEEWIIYKSNPHFEDSDLDTIGDYEEAYIYHTNLLSADTDNDLLLDAYEINHAWNITGITPSVSNIMIGGIPYDDHTDPNNPDTDSDGVLDGLEGAFGSYFGFEDNYPEGSDPILIFNDGYIHPLDNDTDDDSYAQYYDGSISGDGPTRIFLRDMTDGVELAGIRATTAEFDAGVIEYVSKVFYTNPCNPDSDGDTGATPAQRQDAPLGAFLNSDGYELSMDPATDPLDGDTDDDSLIDGLEGTLKYDRIATTNGLNPDTDGDGIPDGVEFTLGLDAGNPDTDADLVLDGDEYYIYHTDPLLADTDFDRIPDGWELFFSHSNPRSSDSDADGLSDADELYIYGTNLVDEDSDNDNLSDRDEIFEFGTDPTSADSDGDGLKDSEEIFIYKTDPNNIDSDYDSILYPDEFGNPTFLLTDGLEVKVYGTDPTSPDTDFDGILDSWEIYLADFDIPGFKNIPLDALNNDTDADGIIDGKELLLNVTHSLIYPYVAVFVYYPFRSSPVNSDTDGDKLLDKFEIDNNLNANSTDSDGDTLTDYDELFIHLTDPNMKDTDGDGIPDNDEVTAAIDNLSSGLELSSVYAPRWATSAVDADSDGDGWPDGLEINGTDGGGMYNPYDPDVNDNGVPDGYERDYDGDMIPDGDEYYSFNTESSEHGGFLDYRLPDSDFDGILDGTEILEYGTMPFNPDTDFDTYSDGLELFIGTDPLVFTTEAEFLAAVRRLNSPIQIDSPEHGKTYPHGKIEVKMLNATNINSAFFRYREYLPNRTYYDNSDWSDNYSLSFSRIDRFGLGAWSSDEVNFANGSKYELQVVAYASNYTYDLGSKPLVGAELFNTVVFTVNNTYWLGITPSIYMAVGIPVFSVAVLWMLTRRGIIKPGKLLRRKKK